MKEWNKSTVRVSQSNFIVWSLTVALMSWGQQLLLFSPLICLSAHVNRLLLKQWTAQRWNRSELSVEYRLYKHTHHVLRWTLTALVEVVEPGDVIATHLLSIAKGHVGVRDGDHGGLVVLGEGVPTKGHRAVRHTHGWTHMYTQYTLSRAEVKPGVLTCGTAWQSCNHRECPGWGWRSSWSCAPFLKRTPRITLVNINTLTKTIQFGLNLFWLWKERR